MCVKSSSEFSVTGAELYVTQAPCDNIYITSLYQSMRQTIYGVVIVNDDSS